MPQGELVIALDRVLARLDKSQIIPKNVADVKADPPPIFYSASDAILVNIDSDPIWSPIMGNDLKFAVNTNWDLFQHSQTNTYLPALQRELAVGHRHQRRVEAGGQAPRQFQRAAGEKDKDTDNWKEVRDALPGKSLKASQVPKVFVSTTPAELILLRGPASYVTVGNTKLLWVNNTESDVFRLGRTGPVYFLISGRWFSAPDFTGPWTFATLSLPPEFKQIPLSHDRSRVLASVPGTDQAAEAVLLAQIPQIATVNKKQIKAPDVAYDGGMPQFQPIEKTNLQRAANTDKDIIKVGDLYYMCFQGVWFMGKSPTGPWEATGSVPGEIYTIPASSPSHNVTYVTVEEDKDDTAVYVAAAAYTGMMIAWGCVVWGSGWYYPPYVRLRRLLPDAIARITRATGTTPRTTRGPAPIAAASVGLRSVRRGRRRRELQPEDRDVRARCRGVRSVWVARGGERRTTRAPARSARRGRGRTSTAAGDRRALRAAISGHPTSRVHEQRDRQHHARHAGQRRRRGDYAQHARTGRRRRRADGKRRRLRRPRRERLQEGCGRRLVGSERQQRPSRHDHGRAAQS